jgi:hypothetical protein
LYYKNNYKLEETKNIMTGRNKKMNYPYTYLIRMDKKLKEKLKKFGSEKVREHLEKIEEK